MSTLCRPGNRISIITFLMLIGIVLWSCGGGSDESSNTSDPSPNSSQTDRWDRFDIINFEGGGPESQNVKAVADGQGLVHIFYYKRGDAFEGNQVRYQIHHLVWDSQTTSLIGEEEMLEVRPPFPADGDSGLSNSIILDAALLSDDTPLVAYQGGLIPTPPNSSVPPCNPTFQGDLMVNLDNGTEWDESLGISGDASGKNPLFTDAYVGISGSIAVDRQNTIHMASQCYYEMCDLHSSENPDLMYVQQTLNQLGQFSDTAGIEELVDDYNEYGSGGAGAVSQMGYGCKLVLDAQDNPTILYVGTPDQDGQGEDRTSVRMARKEGNDWQVEIIDILEDWTAESLSAAVAPDGTIGVAYFMEEVDETSYPDHLRYAYRQSDGEWEIDIVDLSSHCGDYPSLAFDIDSRPVIAYYDIHANSGPHRTRKDLKFARFENDRWIKETVASAGDIGRYNTVWVDANNNAYICTYEYNNQQIVLFRERQQ